MTRDNRSDVGSLAVDAIGGAVVVTMANLNGDSLSAHLDKHDCAELIGALVQAAAHAFER